MRAFESRDRERLEVERKMNSPLDPDKLKALWDSLDVKDEEEDFDPVKMFHLHDINTDQVIDSQELR